jgi:hypothetical protein
MRAHIPTTMFTPMSEEVFTGYFAPWSGPAGQAAYYRFLEQIDESYNDDLEANLDRVDVSTLIIWGAEAAGSPSHVPDDCEHRSQDRSSSPSPLPVTSSQTTRSMLSPMQSAASPIAMLTAADQKVVAAVTARVHEQLAPDGWWIDVRTDALPLFSVSVDVGSPL